ncbi:MAG TPA: hypothetical protein VJN90_13240 [Candidatus Acidoferrales bacterium]|nr:hypothetical protein [Candidatus Acidoferrales bacterium]
MQAAAQPQCRRMKFPNQTPDFQSISAISNRYNKLLEFPVTYTKQTTAHHSNRYKIALLSTRIDRAKTESTASPSACPILFTLTKEGGAGCGQWRERWELRFNSEALFRTSSGAISNRYNKLLEFPLTCTKQTVALSSNRYKIALVAQRFLAQIARNAQASAVVQMRGDSRPIDHPVTMQMKIRTVNARKMAA